jgi:hypothetical protein
MARYVSFRLLPLFLVVLLFAPAPPALAQATRTVSINDVTVTEGNSGTVQANFTVSLSSSTFQIVTVQFATSNGTATGGDSCATGVDYVTTSGALVFSPLQSSKTIAVQVCGETANEANETFFVNLSAPVNAAIGDGQGRGTINNDDGLPALSVNDTAVAEGLNGATNSLVFTVVLSPASGQAVSFSWSTSGGTAIGGTGCAAGIDYVRTSDSFTLLPGQTSKTIPVQTCGDDVDEPNETFFLTLSNVTNARLTNAAALGTIVDDDAAPRVSLVSNQSVSEGNSGTTSVVFNANLSNPSSQTTTVDFATADATATGGAACGAGVDYLSTAGTLTYAPGETTRPITVQVCGDTLHETNEKFAVTLSNPSGLTILVSGAEMVIIDEDLAPLFSISDATVVEGNSGVTPMQFTASLSAPSGLVADVFFDTANGTTLTSADAIGVQAGLTCVESATVDFIHNRGTLFFQPGETAKTVTIEVCGDTIFEPGQFFNVNLSNQHEAGIADGQGVGKIINDDSSIGSFGLKPTSATVPAGQHLVYEFTWTVPAPEVWRSLKTMDLRLVDGQGTAIWVRWDESTNTFCVLNQQGRCGPAKLPGSPGVLEAGPTATLYLAESSVQGSGPTGQSVTLRLSLSFKPQAAGRTFKAEVAAVNDLGQSSGFMEAGSLKVQRKK